MKYFLAKSLRLNSTFFNYILICLLLIFSIIILLTIKNSFDYYSNSRKNEEIYRTISVTFNKESNIESIINSFEIEKAIKIKDYDYKIVLKKYDYLSSFLEKNNTEFYYVETNLYTSSNVVQNINLFLKVFIFLISVIVFILISLNVVDLSFSEKKEIALYKLIGCNSKKVLKELLVVLLIYHFLIFLTAVISSYIGILLVNIVLKKLKIVFFLYFIHFKNIFILFVAMIIILIFSILLLFLKIRKIEPILLFKE